ncbi:DUF2381 family protein [Corallococcus macrosporus]|uniref:DUF2381 family protein n=1 Tax=Myxococcus fulvus (strain ATCC BAA-855 / HW-1) TaxID=483219 RepID=F8CMF2_MYXFH|nr:DUF2381 family protein [Corallococcus macrosporus]AEI64019.1 hypothetical protein LILAB_10540 [Corallococcus macrosporus]
MGFRIQSRQLALLALLVLPPVAAAEGALTPSLQMRNVALAEQAEAVRLSTTVPTTLSFDMPIDARAAVLSDGTRVEILDRGERSLTLRALEPLREPVTLRVPLSAASAQAAPLFQLSTPGDVVDAQVRVFREASAPELLRARLAELEARCAAYETALADQRARCAARGPADWVLSGQVEEQGVMVVLLHEPLLGRAADAQVRVRAAAYFQARDWMVFKARVGNDTGKPWRPARAWLEDVATGKRVTARALRFAAEAPSKNGVGRVAVEFGWEETFGNSAEYRLVVEAASGGAPLVIPGVALQDGTPVGK